MLCLVFMNSRVNIHALLCAHCSKLLHRGQSRARAGPVQGQCRAIAEPVQVVTVMLLVQLQGQLLPGRWQARRQLRQERQMLLERQSLRRHTQPQERQKQGLRRQERQKLGQRRANLKARQPPSLLLRSRAQPRPQQSLLGRRRSLLGARPSLLRVQQRRRQQPRAGQEWLKVVLQKIQGALAQWPDRALYRSKNK